MFPECSGTLRMPGDTSWDDILGGKRHFPTGVSSSDSFVLKAGPGLCWVTASDKHVGWLTELVQGNPALGRCVYIRDPLVTLFQKNFRASRLLRFCQEMNESRSVSGHLFFDRSKKYLLMRKLCNFKGVEYLLRWPVMRPFSIGNSMGNVFVGLQFHWISYTNWTRNCSRKLIVSDFEMS